MELLKRIKDRSPEYDSVHENLISRFTLTQGGRAGTAGESSTWEQGKYFATKYEIYMYATLMGLKHDYRVPIEKNAKKEKFIEMRSWQPSELADYVVMCILAKSQIDLVDLEDKDDAEVEKEILTIRKTMEEYANGGFDKIRSKLQSDPTFFDSNENCFIDLLDERLS